MTTSGNQSEGDDPFQAAWQDPKKAHALYVDNKFGLMVIPNAKPVVEHHLLVVTREPVAYEDLPMLRRHLMNELVDITSEHIMKRLRPARKVGVCLWGNQVKTAHKHVFPRISKADGAAFFDENLAWASDQQLEATRELLAFSQTLQQAARKRLGVIARCFSA